MPNVPELEQRWIKYRYKRLFPFMVSFFILIILFILIVIYYNDTTKTRLSHEKTKIKPTVSKQIKIKRKQIIKIKQQQKLPPKQIEIMKNTQILQPSMNFMNQIGNSIISPYQEHKAIVIKKQISSHAKKITRVKIIIKKLKMQKTPINESNKIIITTKPISKNMQNIIKRFKQSNDPTLSLFLAKRYYQMKKYNLAYNYALITNQLDNNNNTSWIIFIKSLVKLGQKNMAIKTLKAYIRHSKSQDAKTLLNKIESGRFK